MTTGTRIVPAPHGPAFSHRRLPPGGRSAAADEQHPHRRDADWEQGPGVENRDFSTFWADDYKWRVYMGIRGLWPRRDEAASLRRPRRCPGTPLYAPGRPGGLVWKAARLPVESVGAASRDQHSQQRVDRIDRVDGRSRRSPYSLSARRGGVRLRRQHVGARTIRLVSKPCLTFRASCRNMCSPSSAGRRSVPRGRTLGRSRRHRMATVRGVDRT